MKESRECQLCWFKKFAALRPGNWNWTLPDSWWAPKRAGSDAKVATLECSNSRFADSNIASRLSKSLSAFKPESVDAGKLCLASSDSLSTPSSRFDSSPSVGYPVGSNPAFCGSPSPRGFSHSRIARCFPVYPATAGSSRKSDGSRTSPLSTSKGT